MAQIIEAPQGGKKGRAKKSSPVIDMTPMVDLMCLLIVFFMLTTAFTKEKVMDMTLPEELKDPNQEAPKISASRTLNVLLGPDGRVFYYPGAVNDFDNLPPLTETDFSDEGIRRVLLERNRALFRKIEAFENDILTGAIVLPRDSIESAISQLKKDDDTGPIVLIKAYKESTYGNFVDILDEMNICGIARYTIMNIAWYEEAMIERALGISTTAATASAN
jgi:biopolymer transport protein ExbD